MRSFAEVAVMAAPNNVFSGGRTYKLSGRCTMVTFRVAVLIVMVCSACSPARGRAADGQKDELQGVWVATAIDISGKLAPPDEIKATRFTFKGDKVLVRHPTFGKREVEATFKADREKSPKQLDIDLIKLSSFVGIYEVNGDELRICYVTNNNPKNRPTKFASPREEPWVLIVFKRQMP
jgi:uncharacterized protein (TIGR03067 family)